VRKALPSPRLDWGYFLDVDGTLLEFADHPARVHVDDALLAMLCRLHGAAGGAVALVSGRCIAELDRLLDARRLPAAGLHGIERRDAAGVTHRHEAAMAAVASVREGLRPLLARHPGLLFEDKGAAVAVHYRQAPRLGGAIHRSVRSLLRRAGPALQMQPGKRIVEVRPSGRDKGIAIEEFLAEPPFLGRRPVFIGDDATDEHGFAAVNRRGGVSIKVGPGRTKATHRLPSVDAARAWLAGALPPLRSGERECTASTSA
jgi:trehalose 6-phosphate phosphatase